jgi:hypothetical protein
MFRSKIDSKIFKLVRPAWEKEYEKDIRERKLWRIDDKTGKSVRVPKDDPIWERLEKQLKKKRVVSK